MRPVSVARLARPLTARIALLFLLFPALSPAQEDPVSAPEIVPEWGLVGDHDATRTVFISPEGLRDRAFVEQVLTIVTAPFGRANRVRVLIFDGRDATPRRLPMTDVQTLHLRAEYERDAGGRGERFVWVSVVDRSASPPKLSRTEANLRPRRAG